VDGVAPYNFELDELSLLENLEPGDPTAWVRLAEAMESQEMQIKVLRPNLSDFREDTFRKVVISPDLGVEELHAIPKTDNSNSYVPVALFFYKVKGWTSDKIDLWLKDNPQYAPQTQAPQPTSVAPIVEAKKPPEPEKREETPLARARRRMKKE
jgi:hypothetical protein